MIRHFIILIFLNSFISFCCLGQRFDPTDKHKPPPKPKTTHNSIIIGFKADHDFWLNVDGKWLTIDGKEREKIPKNTNRTKILSIAKKHYFVFEEAETTGEIIEDSLSVKKDTVYTVPFRKGVVNPPKSTLPNAKNNP